MNRIHVSLLLRKLVRLPTAVELGRSDSEALPSRDFGHAPEDYTWEDWEEEVKEKYPVRFFISETLGGKVDLWRAQAENAVYWLKCHTLPEYRGYSRIDIRRPGPGIPYYYGWIDRSEALLYAAFVCLRDFVEKEEPRDPAASWPLEEIAADVQLQYQKDSHDEIMALYHWWMKGRLEEEAEEDRLYSQLAAVRGRQGDDPEFRTAADAWNAYRKFRADREDEMLIRLCKVRGRLWT